MAKFKQFMVTSLGLVMLIFQCASATENNFDLIEKAHKKQIEAKKEWDRLIEDGTIQVGKEKLSSKGTRPIYKFSAGKMNVKDVFRMLQNWPIISAEEKINLAFIEIPIAGDKYTFRISQDLFKNGQIYITPKKGGKGISYKDFFRTIRKQKTRNAEIAKFMLHVAETEVGSEKPAAAWKEEYTFLKKENVKNDVFEIMVVGQVAEAARPSDKSFDEWRKANKLLNNPVLKTRETKWKEEIDAIFKANKISIEQSKYKELFDLAVDWTGAIPAGAEKEKVLKQILGKKEAKKIEGKEVDSFYQKIVKSVKTVTQSEMIEYKKLTYSKSGRVPLSDDVFRETLKVVTEQGNFEQPFKELFKIHLTTNEGRYDTIYNKALGKRLRKNEEQRQNERLQHQIDPLSNSRARHDKDAINKRTKKYMEKKAAQAGKVCRNGKRSVCDIKYKLIKGSVELSENKLSFSEQDENGFKTNHEIEIDTSKLSTPQYAEEHNAELNEDIRNSKTITHIKTIDKINKGIGAYGAIVNTLVTVQYFSEEKYSEGAFTLSQAAHAIGGLTGINKVASAITKRAFQKVTSYTMKKIGLEKALLKLSQRFGTRSAAKALGRFSGEIPIVGLIFDGYFIYEDWEDLQDDESETPDFLKYAHLILDVGIAILSFVPPLLPVTTGLVIIRLTIDDFYNNIAYELSKVKGDSFLDKVLAFIVGYGKSLLDIYTLGLVSQTRFLNEQTMLDADLLRNFSNATSYFDITFQGQDENGTEVGTVDFTAGILSQYGGFLTIKLNDDNSITVTLPEVPTENGGTTTVTKTIKFDKPVDNILLGVGKVVTPTYAQQYSKLWVLLPYQEYNLINTFDEHQSTQYGIYRGNDNDNDFYALQGKKRRKRSDLSVDDSVETINKYDNIDEFDKPSQYHDAKNQYLHSTQQRKKWKTLSHLSNKAYQQECYTSQSNDEIVVYLRSYHYDLFGGGGNDRFFLGPQSVRVSGDEGSDLYYLQPDGGKAVIDNFALDEEQDTIFLNISYKSVQCYRKEWDLMVEYCGTHEILLRNWFVHGNAEYHRHIFIVTQDGIGIEVTETEIELNKVEASCNPVSVDKSRSEYDENIRLENDFKHVKQVIGSNNIDNIVGNDIANTLVGGLDDDFLEGGNGPDVYLVKKGDGIDTINNFAIDEIEDTLIFGINYENVIVKQHNYDLVLCDSENAAETVTTVEVKNWFKSSQHQHMAMVSKDYVRFVIGRNLDGTPKTVSLTIDFGDSKAGVTLDLLDENEHFNEETRNEVEVMFDSNFDDVLKANTLGNFLSCSGGNDYLEGRGQQDVYVIDTTCTSATINNYDSQQDFDLILFKCHYESIRLAELNDDLKLKCTTTKTEIIMKNWFLSEDYQHCMLKTFDKITTFLPEDDEELHEFGGKLFPVEIESDEDCNNESRHIDLTLPINSKVERFTANTDACSFDITGNNLNNYIDPGPGNPFGYQQLSGGNGADTYIIGHSYGLYNNIDNSAEDGAMDHLMFNVLFHDIKASKSGTDVSITSIARNDSVKATLKGYFADENHQHILIHSVDNFIFVPTEEEPYIAVKMMDFSNSPYSQVININDSSTIIAQGSLNAENLIINSGTSAVKITGGNKDDNIVGGTLDEVILGLDGDDMITGGNGHDYIFGGDGSDNLKGGEGDDVIYGGFDADEIDGGEGDDYIVFSGENFTGVTINLQTGSGWGSDAEGDTYTSIESILATEYDDTLFGNDDDNFLVTYGGSDYIMPGGGSDVLHGGTGNDFYDLSYVSGRKTINNFATDVLDDLVLLEKTKSNSMCYFYLDTDLNININYQTNDGTNFARILYGRDFLFIKISHFLRNTTYQHISILFSDILFHHTDFATSGKQLDALYNQILSGHILEVSSNSQTSLQLKFNFTSLGSEPPSPSNYKVEYVHNEWKSIKYNTISWPMQGGSEIVTINNAIPGYGHKFIVILTSCNLNVAISPEVMYTTPPSPPTNLSISDITFDGFTLSWSPPVTQTNPLSHKYQYIITIAIISSIDKEEKVITVDKLSYITYDLLPETDYRVSVVSIIDDVKSLTSSTKRTKTGKNGCMNLQNLPTTLKIYQFIKIDGIVHAYFYCLPEYKLIGNTEVACNDKTNAIPTCEGVTCSIPHISNAVIRTIKNEKYEDINCSTTAHKYCEYVWECSYGFEVNESTRKFNIICLETGWSPQIQTCVKTPACTGLSAPSNGTVDATAIYVNEHIEYSCLDGYELQGPSKSQCLRGSEDSVYLSPENIPNCKSLPCPDLLPQPNGIYSETRVFYTGESVTVTCNNGYYIRDAKQNPHQKVLKCLGDRWKSEQTHCKISFTVIGVKENIFNVKGIPKYSFSKWSYKRVDPSLYQQACILIGGVDSTYESIDFTTITCNRRYSLVDGPDNYTGYLQVSTSTGNQKVCVNDIATAEKICNKLGYSDYSASIVTISSHTTTLKIEKEKQRSFRRKKTKVYYLVNKQKSCTKAIKCRAKCPDLSVHNGNDCYQTLEKETCSLDCSTGYELIGSSTRTCSSNGEWTGQDTYCDGKPDNF